MIAGRMAAAIGFAGLAAGIIITDRLPLAAALTMASVIAFVLVADSPRRGLLMLWPIAFFAAALLVLQWTGGTAGWRLPLRTIGVFACVASAGRLAPWMALLRRSKPGSAAFSAVLFLFLLRHFAAILGAESRRALVARQIMLPRRHGPGWFRSLRWALAGLFDRNLTRVERFYAAQLVRGLGQ